MKNENGDVRHALLRIHKYQIVANTPHMHFFISLSCAVSLCPNRLECCTVLSSYIALKMRAMQPPSGQPNHKYV